MNNNNYHPKKKKNISFHNPNTLIITQARTTGRQEAGLPPSLLLPPPSSPSLVSRDKPIGTLTENRRVLLQLDYDPPGDEVPGEVQEVRVVEENDELLQFACHPHPRRLHLLGNKISSLFTDCVRQVDGLRRSSFRGITSSLPLDGVFLWGWGHFLGPPLSRS